MIWDKPVPAAVTPGCESRRALPAGAGRTRFVRRADSNSACRTMTRGSLTQPGARDGKLSAAHGIAKGSRLHSAGMQPLNLPAWGKAVRKVRPRAERPLHVPGADPGSEARAVTRLKAHRRDHRAVRWPARRDERPKPDTSARAIDCLAGWLLPATPGSNSPIWKPDQRSGSSQKTTKETRR